jgi:hypothetical protein
MICLAVDTIRKVTVACKYNRCEEIRHLLHFLQVIENKTVSIRCWHELIYFCAVATR